MRKVRAGEMRATEVRGDEVPAAEVRAGEVRTGEVRIPQADVPAVGPGVPASNDSDGGLHVGAHHAVWHVSVGS